MCWDALASKNHATVPSPCSYAILYNKHTITPLTAVIMASLCILYFPSFRSLNKCNPRLISVPKLRYCTGDATVMLPNATSEELNASTDWQTSALGYLQKPWAHAREYFCKHESVLFKDSFSPSRHQRTKSMHYSSDLSILKGKKEKKNGPTQATEKIKERKRMLYCIRPTQKTSILQTWSCISMGRSPNKNENSVHAHIQHSNVFTLFFKSK